MWITGIRGPHGHTAYNGGGGVGAPVGHLIGGIKGGSEVLSFQSIIGR